MAAGKCDNYNRKSHRLSNNMSRTNLSGNVGHVIIFSSMFTICVLFSNRVRVRIGVRIRFSVWLVSCYAPVFVRLWVVIVTDRGHCRFRCRVTAQTGRMVSEIGDYRRQTSSEGHFRPSAGASRSTKTEPMQQGICEVLFGTAKTRLTFPFSDRPGLHLEITIVLLLKQKSTVMESRTQASRPRPKTQPSRPKPRPRTRLSRPRPRPRSSKLSSRILIPRGRGLVLEDSNTGNQQFFFTINRLIFTAVQIYEVAQTQTIGTFLVRLNFIKY